MDQVRGKLPEKQRVFFHRNVEVCVSGKIGRRNEKSSGRRKLS